MTSDIKDVLEKYKDAEKIMPIFERVELFSWNDMLSLKDEIEILQSRLDACNKQYNDISSKLRKIRHG